MNVIFQHLRRPLRHTDECQRTCADGCHVRAFNRALNEPVLASEVEAERRTEARFQALARGALPTS